MGKATQAGRLSSAQTKERSSRNVKMPHLLPVSGFTDPHLPCGSRKASIFSDNAPAEAHCWWEPHGNSLLGLGRHLLFESYMAYTHSIGTKQLSELSLQRVSRLLLVPRLLCARLTGRLACDTLLRVSPSDGPFSGTPDL
jgi:hypothetical protein